MWMQISTRGGVSGYIEGCLQCQPAQYAIERLLPMITVGYAIHDIQDGIRHRRKDFILHGSTLLLVFGAVCHLQMEHHVTCMLTMEVSTIFLNMRKFPWK